MSPHDATPNGSGTAPGATTQSLNDLVYPLHEFDDSPVNRYMMLWTMRFDAILDDDKLCSSLTRLFEQGDWRKLGGRLHLKDDNRFEVHSPREYTRERPPFQFSTQRLPMRTLDHPVAKNLPRATGQLGLFPGNTSQFRPVTLGPDWAPDFAAHVRSREPLFGFHVTIFHDTTLISLRWAHIVSDYMGIKGLLLAWGTALQDRWDEIPPLLGALEDPLKDIGAGPPGEPFVLEKMELDEGQFKTTMDKFLDHMAEYPITVRRMLVLPDWALRKIKRDFAGGSPSDTIELLPKGALFNGQFVSDGDILTVWAARLCCGILPAEDRPVLVAGMYEARGCLPETFPQRKDRPASSPVFVANATFSTYTNTTLHALRDQPLARSALLAREAVATQTKAPQVHALLRRLREVYAATDGRAPVFAAEGSYYLTFSNFSKMRFFDDVDFSPAVVTAADEVHGASPGMIAWHQWTSIEHDHVFIRNMVQVGGKDARGNTWVMGVLPDASWKVVEAHLAGLSDDAGTGRSDDAMAAAADVSPSRACIESRAKL